MPYPSQIELEEIVREAGRQIEAEGAAALSMGGLAEALGVRAPSLYRYVKGRDALLQAVNLETLQRLFGALEAALALAPAEPAARLTALALAFRAFAHNNPQTYILAFTSRGARRPDERLLAQLALPLQQLIGQITGEADSLAALRGLLALIHGFVLLELNEQLQRGGDLGADFAWAVEAYLKGSRE